jgi:peptidoglycan/LPS O-acetylase OafA/YrhL
MDSPPKLGYRPDIDGIRAIAILAVIAFHAFPALLRGGFVGVDMFFVISGFLISRIILGGLESETFSLVDFYKRRIRRIFPALILLLVTVLCTGWLLFFASEYTQLGKHVASAAGFVPNFTYMNEAGRGYFDTASNVKPLLHLWSIGIEEQFYLILPALFMLFFKKSRKITFLILFLFTLSFLSNYVGFFSKSEAFYSPFTRFWEFLPGSLAAYFYFRKGGGTGNLITRYWDGAPAKVRTMLPDILSTIGIATIALSTFFIESSFFHAKIALFPVLGTVLLIVAGKEAWINRKILAQPILVWIGLVSYPLYLWHWPLLSFTRIIESHEPSLSTKCFLILLSFLFAGLTYHVIEKPVRASRKKSVLFALIFLMLLVGTAGFVVYEKKGLVDRFPQQESILKTAKRGEGINSECLNMFPETSPTDYCLVTGTGKKYIFILGDSHSQAISMGYSDQIADLGYTAIHLGITGCPFFMPENMIGTEDTVLSLNNRLTCNKKMKHIFRILEAYNPEGVIISHAGWVSANGFLESGMEETLSRIPKKTKVVWVLQNPSLPFDITACVERRFDIRTATENCSFPRETFDAVTVGYKTIVSKILKRHPGVSTIDPSDIICNAQTCSAMLDNKLLYSDSTHLSKIGGMHVGKKFPAVTFFPNLKK